MAKVLKMKLRIYYLFLLTLFFYESNAQSLARVENIKIQSAALGQEREILIYTPVDYDWRVLEYFNVIYVFDSQHREFFDYTSAVISFLTNKSESYIIVGITSPYNEALDYSRNNDLLPVLETQNSIQRHGKYSGNADNFLKYIGTEVIPYINSNYRVLNSNIAVGHSLSASFILYALVNNTDLFRNYIAISPNLAYDDEKLCKDLISFNYSKIKNSTYIYVSSADEGIGYWQEWKPAREKLYSFFEDTLKTENVKIKIADFQKNNHWNTFPPSLNDALEYYFKDILQKQEKELSEEMYEITIRVKVPDEKDTLYITGNQFDLGDWDPEKVKMTKVSEYERTITLKLKSPAQFKFTRGSWDSEAEVDGTYDNITIKPELKTTFEFEIENYLDRLE